MAPRTARRRETVAVVLAATMETLPSPSLGRLRADASRGGGDCRRRRHRRRYAGARRRGVPLRPLSLAAKSRPPCVQRGFSLAHIGVVACLDQDDDGLPKNSSGSSTPSRSTREHRSSSARPWQGTVRKPGGVRQLTFRDLFSRRAFEWTDCSMSGWMLKREFFASSSSDSTCKPGLHGLRGAARVRPRLRCRRAARGALQRICTPQLRSLAGRSNRRSSRVPMVIAAIRAGGLRLARNLLGAEEYARRCSYRCGATRHGPAMGG